MIVGAHVMLQSKNGEADIAFFRDILNLPHVDAGEGFLLFGVPRSEVAVHASDSNDAHKLYLMCDDVGAFIKEMEARGIAATPVQDQGWGSLTEVTLPGGGSLSVYQPQHPRPKGRADAGEAKKKKKGGKDKKKGAKAAKLTPEKQAKRAERQAARKAGGAGKKAGATPNPERQAKKESRQAKRTEKKAARASSASSTSAKKT